MGRREVVRSRPIQLVLPVGEMLHKLDRILIEAR